MGDYLGNATLADWLKFEVLYSLNDLPENIVAMFDEWSESVVRDIDQWLSSHDGYGRSVSWQAWGRGYSAIPESDNERFKGIVTKAREMLRAMPVVETLNDDDVWH